MANTLKQIFYNMTNISQYWALGRLCTSNTYYSNLIDFSQDEYIFLNAGLSPPPQEHLSFNDTIHNFLKRGYFRKIHNILETLLFVSIRFTTYPWWCTSLKVIWNFTSNIEEFPSQAYLNLMHITTHETQKSCQLYKKQQHECKHELN